MSCAPWSAHQIDGAASWLTAATGYLVVDVADLLLQITDAGIAELDRAAVAAGGTGTSELLLMGHAQAIPKIGELLRGVVAIKSHAPMVGALL